MLNCADELCAWPKPKSCFQFPRGTKKNKKNTIHCAHHTTDPALLGQVTHAHMLRYEVADEEDQNRNQSWAMNIRVGHGALSNQFSVPERCSPKRQSSKLFDHCSSVKNKTLFSLRFGAGKWQDWESVVSANMPPAAIILPFWRVSLNDECLCPCVLSLSIAGHQTT